MLADAEQITGAALPDCPALPDDVDKNDLQAVVAAAERARDTAGGQGEVPALVAAAVSTAVADLAVDPSDWMGRLAVRNRLGDFINETVKLCHDDAAVAQLTPAEHLFDQVTTSIEEATGPGSHEAKVALARRQSDEGFDMTARLAELEAELGHWPAVLAHEQGEVERLVNAIVEPQSVALQRAISRTADLKIKAVEAGRVGMPDPSDEEQTAWEAAREALNDEAYAMSEAPITSATDALIRAEAFIDAVGRCRKTGLTEDDNGDLLQLVASYQDALKTLAAREPDPTEWDDAVRRLRRVERALHNALSEEEGLDRAALVEDGLREEVAGRVARLYSERDEARVELLAMEPPHVGGLLVQLEIICDHACMGNQQTYQTRAKGLGAAPFTADELWRRDDDKRGFFLIATNAAKLRDRSLPSDWREILDRAPTPAAQDAVRNAADAGLASEDVTAEFLAPTDPKHPPFLAATTPAGQQLLCKPDHVWEWRPCQ